MFRRSGGAGGGVDGELGMFLSLPLPLPLLFLSLELFSEGGFSLSATGGVADGSLPFEDIMDVLFLSCRKYR